MTDPKTEETPQNRSNFWEGAERIAKLFSLIAIPVVLCVGGWLIQSSLAERSVSQEYVKLAVTILKEPKDKTDNPLRAWAADLLNQNSPTKFSPAVLQTLREGQATLPAQLAAILHSSAGGSALAVSPDGARLATGHTDGTAKIWDASTGKLLVELQGHSDSVTALAFLPDAASLLNASLDMPALLWDLHTGREISRLADQTDSSAWHSRPTVVHSLPDLLTEPMQFGQLMEACFHGFGSGSSDAQIQA
ncbi:WD40 repeat domain-containing protein [Nitrosomonas supralitoralis]|uniref:Uncharacterized protein n=1 Tax=Nitrosomonas supralitoralis TaxID=2116706 RepID=A0A2P7NY96_9PROT|nr:hypothetical protein [Nitrosomonas supralitoralis]PSJ18445.1 hypothetical protein C7H79_02340 [Nitrosomonas supralitoralis]